LRDLKMNVLMIISQFKPIVGGAERQAELLAHALVTKGINVSIVTGWWEFGTPHKEGTAGVQIIRNFSCWRMFGIKGLRTLGALFYAISLGVYLLIHRKEYDILHVHQVLYPAFIATLIGGGILKKPVLAKMACSGLTSDIRNIRRFPLGDLQLKYLIKKTDRLVTVNEEGGKEFHALGYPLSKIRHIPNGVALVQDGKTYSSRINYIITTVRLDYQKGIDILLKAWSRIKANQNNLKLLTIGKGPHETEFKSLSQSLGISGSVEFIGEVPQVEDYLKKADIFVLASRAEGMSNSLLEAMGYGLTCIATNISGNVELIAGKGRSEIHPGEFMVARNGILINSEDAEALSRAVDFLVGDQKIREMLGKNARECIKNNYSIDLIADNYIELYRHLLRGSKECAGFVAS